MSSKITNSEILKTRQHYDILDGLRGVAALAIVIFHFMEWIYTHPSKNFIGHGFLAVDFFFCLSGFVIAYAYDSRISAMGVFEFFKSRLIRLHPLVIFGSILGLAGFIFDPFTSYSQNYGVLHIAWMFICSILLIPFPVMAERSFNLFSFNAPAWSLFWEYIANVVYAFVLCKLRRRYLLIFTIVAAISLCFVSYRAGNLLGGWSKGTFWDGAVRVSFSFLAGLSVYRFKWIIKNKLGFLGLSFLLILGFIIPFSKWNWITELMIVIFYFPLIVSLGAGSTLTFGRKISIFSGKISYPLYMTHYAAIWIFGSYYTLNKPTGSELFLIVFIGTILLITFAYLIMSIYDIPLRKYLTKKRLANK
jgi:peptidoglycan/LPS O-acetylase OafA/YrhL